MESIRNPYQKHLFVCVHTRDHNDEASCSKAGEEIFECLKAYVNENGLKGKIRVSRSGCFDFCAQGPNVMVFPDYIWYRQVKKEDVEKIIQEHLQRQ